MIIFKGKRDLSRCVLHATLVTQLEVFRKFDRLDQKEDHDPRGYY